MDKYNAKSLFRQLVVKETNHSDNGIIEFPLSALREYHDAMGYEPEVKCALAFDLEDGEEGIYNYIFGEGSDTDALIMLGDVYYFDRVSEEYEPIRCGKVLRRAIYRDLRSGEALICGHMIVNQDGELFIQAMQSENIGVDLRLRMGENSTGFQFLLSDMSKSCQIWSDGDTMFVEYSLFACWDNGFS